MDVLVNNAGMSPLYDRIENVTEDLWDKVLDVNLKGPFRLTALVGARMAAGAGGSIIMVSSTAAVRPTANVIPYAAAKAAVNAMTEGFARAFGPTVRVNCIMPGPFLTDISKAWDLEAFRARAKADDGARPRGRARGDRRRRALLRLRAPRASPPARCSASTEARPDARSPRSADRARPVRGRAGPARRGARLGRARGVAAPAPRPRCCPRRAARSRCCSSPTAPPTSPTCSASARTSWCCAGRRSGEIAPGAHDMKREFQVLSRLWRHFDRAPARLPLLRRPRGAGRRLLRHGAAPRRGGPRHACRRPCARIPDVGRRVAFALVEAMADLHALDPAACGLGDLGRPDGFVDRQLDGWAKRWALARPDGRDGRHGADPRAPGRAASPRRAARRSSTTISSSTTASSPRRTPTA